MPLKELRRQARGIVDFERSQAHDFADDGVWSAIRDDLTEGKYHVSGHAPPCWLFCANRSNDGGPRALRGPHPPELYGFDHLTPEEKETVRLGTLHVVGKALGGSVDHHAPLAPSILE